MSKDEDESSLSGENEKEESSDVAGGGAEKSGLKQVREHLTGGAKKIYTGPRDAIYRATGVYEDDGEINEDRRAFVQAGAAGLGIAAAFSTGRSAEEYGLEDLDMPEIGRTQVFGSDNTSDSPAEEEFTPEESTDTNESSGSTDQSTEPTETPSENETGTPATADQDTKYFETLNDLPEGACYDPQGGVSGYFLVEEVESAIGSEPLEDLNPVEGDIGYDVDFRDSDNDGEPDAYVMQLNGEFDQEDLTVSQAVNLFEQLEPNNYCD